ncbi:hypothetical protein ACSSTO_10190 [Bacillus atrophaeus]|uniref:hypothetical protein n=1 Tax=Bacillus atrophaeus TaxID=1452 RepID=UPI003EDA81FC
MNDDLRKFFTIGEFAIEKQTLFHYVLPNKKENGYRYYCSNQLELFQVSNLFKEAGLPLKRQTPGRIVPLLLKLSLY